jgi:hypothetical protein
MSKYLAAILRKDSFLGLYIYESVTKPPTQKKDRYHFTVIGNDVIFNLGNINQQVASSSCFFFFLLDYEYPKTVLYITR